MVAYSQAENIERYVLRKSGIIVSLLKIRILILQLFLNGNLLLL